MGRESEQGRGKDRVGEYLPLQAAVRLTEQERRLEGSCGSLALVAPPFLAPLRARLQRKGIGMLYAIEK